MRSDLKLKVLRLDPAIGKDNVRMRPESAQGAGGRDGVHQPGEQKRESMVWSGSQTAIVQIGA